MSEEISNYWDHSMKLNLGARTVSLPGFKNVDLFDGPLIDIVDNASDLSTIPDGVVEEIYASHLIEHFSYEITDKVLARWYSVLKPGGKLLIECPDFDRLSKAYTQGILTFVQVESAIFGKMDEPGMQHFALFNFSHLKEKLTKAGFENISEIDTPAFSKHDKRMNLAVQANKPLQNKSYTAKITKLKKKKWYKRWKKWLSRKMMKLVMWFDKI